MGGANSRVLRKHRDSGRKALGNAACFFYGGLLQ
jgi:hypothetical protein